MKRLLSLALVVWALSVATAQAQTVRTLCASGCTYTNSAANFQTAINASVGGDSILLQEGTTYDVAVTLPSHAGASMVTIRTGVTSTGGVIAAGQFPAAGVRMTPTLATSSNLATLRALTNNTPAVRTATAIGSGGYWTLKHLAVTGNAYGGEALIQLGSDSNNAGEQDSIARIPANFALEQIYVYGNPVSGQFRGVRTHANTVTIKDSTIKDIKATSEGQAIYGNSFSTGLTISNNYIEGGAEGILFGGAGGCCHPTATVSAATNASTFTVSTFTDLYVGLGISVEISGAEEWTQVASCGGVSTVGTLCASGALVVSPALSATPAVSADVDWGVIPSDVTFEKNYVVKPTSWRNAIIGTPQSAVAVAAETGGTLAAGTYSYRVVARHPVAVNTTARSAASAEVAAVIAGTTGSVAVRWTPVTNATTYYIYGRNSGAQNIRWSVTTSACTATVCEYVDTGSAGTAEAVPTSGGDTWFVKNIFEIKNGRRMTVNGNVFDGVWNDGQTGYAILFTVANTGNGNDSTTIEDITFSNNIIRNAAGVMQIVGRDVSTTPGGQVSARAKRITVSNNLAYNIGSEWGASVRTVILTTTGPKAFYPNNTASNGPLDVIFNHNTFLQTSGNAMLYLDLFKTSAQAAENMTWTNNIGVKLGYGLTGNNSCAQGDGCWTAHTSGTPSWQNNVTADAVCSAYPGGAGENFCPSLAALQQEFVDYAAGNFALAPSSPYNNAGSDGADIGADIAAITALTDIASSGTNTGAAPVVPPAVLTLSLADGQVASVYSAIISGSCPTAPCTWGTSGTLPPGLALTQDSNTQATFGGTALTSGTYPFAITLTDAGGRVATHDFNLTIVATVPVPDLVVPTRPDRQNNDEGVNFRRPTDPCAEPVEPVRVGDLWADTSYDPPATRLLRRTAPSCEWRFVIPFTVRKTAIESVTSSTALQDDDELTVTLPANTTWVIDYFLYGDGDATADVKFALSVPTGTTGVFGFSANPASETLSDAGVQVGALTSSVINTAVMRAIVNIGATAGAVTLRWAQNASHATPTRIRVNSNLVARQF